MSDIREELADWIDTDVIAERILEDMEGHDVSLSLENAKTIWLDVLENELCEAIGSSVKARFNVV